MFKRVMMILLMVLAAGVAVAQQRPVRKGSGSTTDWPRFRGPNGDCTSDEKGLLREWPKEGPKVLWRFTLGTGWSPPSVAGNDLIIHSMDAPGEVVYCLDATTGKKRWDYGYKLGAPTWQWGVGWDKGGPRGTPSVTDKYVVTLGILGNLFCLDRKNGHVVWKKDFLEGKEAKNPGDWKGFCHSPLVVSNAVVLEQGNADCLALDVATGKELWHYKKDSRADRRGGGGQSPTVARFNNQECVVFVANAKLTALRVSDGKEVWSFEHLPSGRVSNIPTPVVSGNYIFDIPDLDSPVMVEVQRDKPPFPAHIAWKKDFVSMNYYHNLVAYNGYLYGFWTEVDLSSVSDLTRSPFDLVCLDMKTGKEMWREKNFPQPVSIIEADGLLFARCHQTLMLIEATPKGYRLKGKMTKLHDKINVANSVGLVDWVSPVLSNGKLYVRLPSELLCLNVAGPKAKAGTKPAPATPEPADDAEANPPAP